MDMRVSEIIGLVGLLQGCALKHETYSSTLQTMTFIHRKYACSHCRNSKNRKYKRIAGNCPSMILTFKKIWASIGILATVAHLGYYAYAQYNWFYFFLGFGMLWLVFVAPVKYLL